MNTPNLSGEALVGKHLVPGVTLSADVLAGYYNQNALDSKEGFDANDWADPEQMYNQFKFLTDHIDLKGKSLLDVGSGNGLLFSFLNEKKIEVIDPTAIDLASEQIAILKRLHPNVNAIVGDFFKYEYEQTFDVVTLFGVAPCVKFIFPDKDRIGSLMKLIDRAVRYAREAVCFSFLNRNCYEMCEVEGYEYTYYYPEEICTLLSGGSYEISTAENDLVTNCILNVYDANDEPFRFNLTRIDSVFNLYR